MGVEKSMQHRAVSDAYFKNSRQTSKPRALRLLAAARCDAEAGRDIVRGPALETHCLEGWGYALGIF